MVGLPVGVGAGQAELDVSGALARLADDGVLRALLAEVDAVLVALRVERRQRVLARLQTLGPGDAPAFVSCADRSWLVAVRWLA